MKGSRVAVLGLLALLTTGGPTLAMERWGRCVEVDARFHKIVVMQDGNKRHFPLRINADTIFVLRDGRTTPAAWFDLRQLENQRVYAIVEENPDHFITKIWLRPDLPPSLDPVNPGAGATHPKRAGLPLPEPASAPLKPQVEKPSDHNPSP